MTQEERLASVSKMRNIVNLTRIITIVTTLVLIYLLWEMVAVASTVAAIKIALFTCAVLFTGIGYGVVIFGGLLATQCQHFCELLQVTDHWKERAEFAESFSGHDLET